MQRIRSLIRLGTQVRWGIREPVAAGRQFQPLTTGAGEGEGIGADLTVGEQRIIAKLQQAFPDATDIQVADVSGGCGAMYQISIETPQFAGKRTVQQHRMVNQALADEIKSMHGLQLKTKAPDSEGQ